MLSKFSYIMSHGDADLWLIIFKTLLPLVETTSTMPVFSSWKVFKLDLTHKTFLPFSLDSMKIF